MNIPIRLVRASRTRRGIKTGWSIGTVSSSRLALVQRGTRSASSPRALARVENREAARINRPGESRRR